MKKELKTTFGTFDIARFCHVSPRTVAKWIDQGQLRGFITVGGHRRVIRNDLWGFMERLGMPVPEVHIKGRSKNDIKK